MSNFNERNHLETYQSVTLTVTVVLWRATWGVWKKKSLGRIIARSKRNPHSSVMGGQGFFILHVVDSCLRFLCTLGYAWGHLRIWVLESLEVSDGGTYLYCLYTNGKREVGQSYFAHNPRSHVGQAKRG